MTYEEALRGMKLLKIKLRPCPQDVEEICDKAIEALEKQIPKKPIRSHNGIKTVYACPICHYSLLYKCGCYNNECRQRIDWGEEE